MTNGGEATSGDRMALEAIPDVRQRRAVPPVHGDDVAVGPEAVDLGVARVVGVGATRHQVHEVVVRVDPRALPEALGRLDGQVVEAEMRAEQLTDHAVGRVVVQIEPEEVGPGQRGEHVLRRRRRVVAALAQRPIQHGHSLAVAGPALGDDPDQPKRPGSNESGIGTSSAGSAVPVMACASTRAENGPCSRPLAP